MQAVTPKPPLLLAEGIHKRYGTNEVLKGVTVQANQGEVISMIGASGSGKSSFLCCLNLLAHPNAGRIVLAGRELDLVPDRTGALKARSAAQLQHLRSQVAMVFQHFSLWAHMTGLENVIEAPMQVLGVSRAQALERAEHCLQRVGVAHRQAAYPAHLSGGEQQRVAIARALAMEPRVMLFDEPTSTLDPECVGEALRVMRSVAEEGRTMIVVTPEMGFAREVSNHLVFLHQGRMEEQGHPREVLAQPQTSDCAPFWPMRWPEGRALGGGRPGLSRCCLRTYLHYKK